MTADVKLLPMPSEPRSALAHWDHTDMKDYARACVAHATAAKDAEIAALRAEVGRLQEIVRPKRDEECLTLDHWRMRAYDLEANWSRCSRACAGEQSKRGEAEAYAERLAEALRDARDYVTTALREEREKFAGHEDCSDIPGIEADLHKIDAALHPTAAQENDDA